MQIQEFIQACETPLNQPIIATNGYKRRAPVKPAARKPGSGTVPRRSSRLAKKESTLPRHTVKRAQRRIMQKLGIIEQDEAPSPGDCQAFDDLFKQTLPQRHIIALAELFTRGTGSVALQSETLADQDPPGQA